MTLHPALTLELADVKYKMLILGFFRHMLVRGIVLDFADPLGLLRILT